MLEALQHAENAFVTLTYEDKNLPPDGGLVPDHLRDWLKRLRRRVEPKRIRYFAVGEYGDQSWRPHYHAAVFGIGCQGSLQKGGCGCVTCSIVRETWQLGHVLVGQLEQKSAQYICGYVTKKMVRKEDLRLGGLPPEFARMSLKPGIGADAIPDVASVMMQLKLEEKLPDVPNSLRHGSKELPLGRYLRRLLRLQCGLDEKAPPEYVEALRQGLLPVFDFARAHTPKGSPGLFREVVRSTFEELNEQASRNMNARNLLHRRKL